MNSISPSDQQRRAIDAPAQSCVLVCGPPGSGKSVTLEARARRLHAEFPGAGILWLRDRSDFARLALAYLGDGVRIVDDVEAESAFANACEPLFAMDWTNFSNEQLDPEIPGLRSPARFLNSAFRLIRRLREQDIDPADFLQRALAGATDFYGRPPNFVDPRLLSALKRDYHNSLNVDAPELQRQYRREVDLVKILGELYRRYVDSTQSSGRMTGRDAVAIAAGKLRAQATRSDRHAQRFALVDDAELLSPGELALLRALFGNELAGVTLAGRTIPTVPNADRIELVEQFRSPPALFAAQNAVLRKAVGRVAGDELELLRTKTVREEAAAIAVRVREWIDAGTPAQRIAVLFRSVRHIERYEDELLDREVPVATLGDVNVFADRRALDALALLWNAYDPFRHEWLLRTLSNPALGLSDASLAVLCAEPADPQTPLFTLDGEPAPTERASRWDPKRDLRLGWNVVRGDRDADLPEETLRTLRRFRAMRQSWTGLIGNARIAQFARTIWGAALAREGRAGSARAAAQQLVLRRLIDRLQEFERESRGATLFDVLEFARLRASSDLETCEDSDPNGCVSVASIDAVRGREFDRVVVAGVRPGSFPLWYAPDNFLMSPRLGVVPRENVGDARAARTAKFSYYVTATKAAEKYYRREREAFAYALARARERVFVTASGSPTRGISAPELVEELRAVKLPGARALEAS
jgi:superfamily I DNA/RNA helicase